MENGPCVFSYRHLWFWMAMLNSRRYPNLGAPAFSIVYQPRVCHGNLSWQCYCDNVRRAHTSSILQLRAFITPLVNISYVPFITNLLWRLRDRETNLVWDVLKFCRLLFSWTFHDSSGTGSILSPRNINSNGLSSSPPTRRLVIPASRPMPRFKAHRWFVDFRSGNPLERRKGNLFFCGGKYVYIFRAIPKWVDLLYWWRSSMRFRFLNGGPLSPRSRPKRWTASAAPCRAPAPGAPARPGVEGRHGAARCPRSCCSCRKWRRN